MNPAAARSESPAPVAPGSRRSGSSAPVGLVSGLRRRAAQPRVADRHPPRPRLWLAVVAPWAMATLLSCGGGGGGAPGPAPTGTRWSDPKTWAGGVLPQAQETVTIEAGRTVVLDVATPGLDCLEIHGTLVADPLVDVAITANCIEVMSGGSLEIGTESQPYSRTATLTLTGPRGVHTARTEDTGLDNDGEQRAIRVMNGGALRLFGATPPRLKTKLAAHAPAGATALTVADSVAWRAGDRIAVSLTDFFGIGETEVLTLAADSDGTALRTTTALETFRWGLLQYPIDTPVNGNGMSLTQGPFTPASPTTPTVLDERAEVINLSRRIVIQGADDADWATNGFGVHVMVMGRQSTAQVRGIEIRRCGQRRAMGRYPFHWHMLSYASANPAGQGGGAYLGDAVAADHFLKDSAIWDSQNRAVTLHGTCGLTVDNVFAFDIKGHAFFMEDGSERRNTITGCLAMKVRDPGAGGRMKIHDTEASGFWLTNPDNTVTFNSGSDCSGRGLWNTYAHACFGLSRNCPIAPNKLFIQAHEDNTGHSNALQGLATDFPVSDEAGAMDGSHGSIYQPEISAPFFIRRNQTWKNRDNGYSNRVGAANYVDWTAADNLGFDFIGKSFDAKLSGALLVGTSLNRTEATPTSNNSWGYHRYAVASYHFAMEIKNITAVNYPAQPPEILGSNTVGGGVFANNDLYIHPIAMGHFNNTGWRLINSDPGYLASSPYFDGEPLSMGGDPERFRYWAISGATWDPNGYWGPAGNYLVPNRTFYSLSLTSSSATSYGGNFLSTPDVFFGLDSIFVNGDGGPFTERCARLNASNAEVAEHTLGDPALIEVPALGAPLRARQRRQVCAHAAERTDADDVAQREPQQRLASDRHRPAGASVERRGRRRRTCGLGHGLQRRGDEAGPGHPTAPLVHRNEPRGRPQRQHRRHRLARHREQHGVGDVQGWPHPQRQERGYPQRRHAVPEALRRTASEEVRRSPCIARSARRFRRRQK